MSFIVAFLLTYIKLILGSHNQLERLLSISACRSCSSTWQTSLRRNHAKRRHWNNEQYERIHSSLKFRLKISITKSALVLFAKKNVADIIDIIIIKINWRFKKHYQMKNSEKNVKLVGSHLYIMRKKSFL